MEVESVRVDNLYNALAEVAYRFTLNEYGPDFEYEASTSLIHTTAEWDKDSLNRMASEVGLDSKNDFIKTFLLEKPQA